MAARTGRITGRAARRSAGADGIAMIVETVVSFPPMVRRPDPDAEPSLPGDDDILAVLAAGIPLQVPSPSLRARVLSAGTPHPLVFLDHEQGIWLPDPAAPVATKDLFCDSGDRLATRLVRLSAGATLPPAVLPGVRSVLVIEGTLVGAHGTLAPGDSMDEVSSRTELEAGTRALVLDLATVAPPVGAPEVHRAANDLWVPMGQGIRLRRLSGEADLRRQLFLLDAEPNATLMEHEHAGTEELYVWRGSCMVAGREMRAGDYHRATAGTAHDATRTGRDGCVLVCSVRDVGVER